MSIKSCRVCGAEFDNKKARNAKTCPKHRISSTEAQKRYFQKIKHNNKCSWCGNYADEGVEFCKPECRKEALRYRAFLKRNGEAA